MSSSKSTTRCRVFGIAYAFPPIARSGTHRTLALVRHWGELGWDATILTVEPRGEQIDEGLLNRVPDSTQIIRTPWSDLIQSVKNVIPFKLRNHNEPPALARADVQQNIDSQNPHRSFRDWLSRWLMTPDSRMGWIFPALRAAKREIRRHRPDVLYSTSPYESAHLIAMLLRDRFKIPWVADFRDPWCDNPFRSGPYTSINRWDAWLERRVMRKASHVTFTTETMRTRAIKRMPCLIDKSSAIYNGFDGKIIEAVAPRRITPPDVFTFAHAGQFYGPRSPRPWFTALYQLFQEEPNLEDRVRLLLIGPEVFDNTPLRELADQYQLGRSVTILGLQSHTETLAYLSGADALILPGPVNKESGLQVPNKLFEYLALKKPIVANFAESTPVASILDEARADAILCPPEDQTALTKALGQLIAGESNVGESDWSGVHKFDRTNPSAQFASIFRQLTGQSSPIGWVKTRRKSSVESSLQKPISADQVPVDHVSAGRISTDHISADASS